MEADLANLRSPNWGLLNAMLSYSKEILVTALAAVGSVAMAAFGVTLPILGAITVTGVPATIGGLYGAGNKYFAARRTVLQKHPMAYLYALGR